MLFFCARTNVISRYGHVMNSNWESENGTRSNVVRHDEGEKYREVPKDLRTHSDSL